MTVATATIFTTDQTIDQGIIAELDAEFKSFRTRIADLSILASATLTDMFAPLGPVVEEVIDIDAIEWSQVKLELVAPAAEVLELAAA